MRLHKHESLWIGVVYFLILLGIALWVRDIPNQPDAFNITLQQLIKTSTTMGDPASFATAAIDIAENGWVSRANTWIFNLWPPGFILLEALILKVLGPEAPVILVLQILAAVLFSIVLTLLRNFLSESVKSKAVFILPLLIFTFPVSRVFLLQPTGISLGESFAIGFFLLCILLAFRSVQRNSLSDAVYAGICLALSAYFRSQFEIIFLALTGWGILLAIAIFSISVKSLPRLNNGGILLAIAIRQYRLRESVLPGLVKTIAVVLLIAHAITIPWRAYHWIHDGSPFWVRTASITTGNSVMTSENLENAHGGFVVAGGGNLVCRIDPTTCGDIVHAKKLFFKTFITHPFEWYSLKFDVIGKYWFSSVQNWVATANVESTSADVATNGLILFALIAIAALLFTRKLRSHGAWILLMWFNISLLSAYVLIFTFAHFEVRYFYFPKIAGIVMLIIICSLYFRPIEKTQGIDTQTKQVLP